MSQLSLPEEIARYGRPYDPTTYTPANNGGWVSPLSELPNMFSNLFSSTNPPVSQTPWSTEAMRQTQMDNLKLQNDYIQKTMKNQEFGLNFNTMNSVMGGLNAAMNLWGGYQSNKLARDQWNTQKAVLNTNMMNQISSYNAALEDRLNYRKQMGGISEETADRMYEERKAKKY